MRKEKLARGVRRRGNSVCIYLTLPNGKPHIVSLGNVTPAAAKQEREKRQREIAEGKYKPQRAPVYTVADLFEPYMLNFSNRGGRDVRRWHLAWKHLKPFVGSDAVGDVTSKKLNEYIAARKALGKANGTINRELTLLKAMFRFGYKQTPVMVERIPAFPDKLKEAEPRKGFIGHAEYRILAANAKELWLRALIACAYRFGFRRGELLNLRVRQVDLFGRWIGLEAGTTKNGQARKASMTPDVFTLLRACISGKGPDDFVFTHEDGSPVRDPRKAWYDLCVRSGLGKVTFVKRKKYRFPHYEGLNLHDFRRSAVRNFVRANVPEKVAMDISGHLTRSVFDRYNITSETDIENASKSIEADFQKFTDAEQTVTKTVTPAFAAS